MESAENLILIFLFVVLKILLKLEKLIFLKIWNLKFSLVENIQMIMVVLHVLVMSIY